MLNSSTVIDLPVSPYRLDTFICFHIKRTNIATVVECYIPLREQYYAGKDNSQRKENPDVQCSAG